MKKGLVKKSRKGFTLIELVVVIAHSWHLGSDTYPGHWWFYFESQHS